jgi:hypothetical protein
VLSTTAVRGSDKGPVLGTEATGARDCSGTPPHAASIPTMHPTPTHFRRSFMGLILLEALGAMILLILIVWWTMFSGRDKGEIPDAKPQPEPPTKTP